MGAWEVGRVVLRSVIVNGFVNKKGGARMTTKSLNARLFSEIHAEIAECEKTIDDATRRMNDAIATRELLEELLLDSQPKVVESVPKSGSKREALNAARYVSSDKFDSDDRYAFRRQVLAALEEQTPHTIREVAERIDLDGYDRNVTDRIGDNLRHLVAAGRVRMVGEKSLNRNKPSKFYVRIALSSNGHDVEKQIVWP